MCAEYEGRNLEEDVVGDTSGHFQALLRAQVTCGRDDGYHLDHDLAQEDADKIYAVSVHNYKRPI